MFFDIEASQLTDLLASVAPVSGSPLLGFDNIPNEPISVIDFHGTDDSVIPYNIQRYHCSTTRKKYAVSVGLVLNNDLSKV